MWLSGPWVITPSLYKVRPHNIWNSQPRGTVPTPTALACMRCAMNQRKELEHLCCYITRPPVVNERLALNDAGQVVLTPKTPYRDGTTHIVMPPLEFMRRLATLVPRPRLDLFVSMA